MTARFWQQAASTVPRKEVAAITTAYNLRAWAVYWLPCDSELPRGLLWGRRAALVPAASGICLEIAIRATGVRSQPGLITFASVYKMSGVGKRRLGRVVFIRHGQSIWNAMPVRFTGWANVPLTDKGRTQARESGDTLKMFGIRPDVAITSLLRRSKDTLEEIMKSDSLWTESVTVINSWRLNERHYGALVGLSKEEATEKMGKEKVGEWRKSWDVAPPPLIREDLYAYREAPWAQPHTFVTDPEKKTTSKIEEKDEKMPLTESLQDCCNRVLPLWREAILPRVRASETVLIVAHANSIRAVVKYIDQVSSENVRKINIPSAIPLVYDFEEGGEGELEARPIGKPDPTCGMRGRYIASKELLFSLRKALTGDNENDQGFMTLLDDSIRNAIVTDPRSERGGRGAVVISTGGKQSLVRSHYAKTALGSLDAP